MFFARSIGRMLCGCYSDVCRGSDDALWRWHQHTSQLGFPRMGRLTVRFALAAHRFFLYHRHSGPIHFDIENRNRLAAAAGQIQLDGFLHFLSFAPNDIFSEGQPASRAFTASSAERTITLGHMPQKENPRIVTLYRTPPSVEFKFTC